MTKRMWAIVIVAAVAAAAAALWIANSRAPSEEVAVVGCMELEKDYRARLDDGRGGVLGTGVGVGNEFVLSGGRPVANDQNARGVSGDYRLTGKVEKEFVRDVNRVVEVVGRISKDADEGQADDARGRDVKDLPVLAVDVWHSYEDYCPASRDSELSTPVK